eukprot:SAG31_NODE_1504_length_8079_cov_2.892607_6_plen_832_part_00
MPASCCSARAQSVVPQPAPPPAALAGSTALAAPPTGLKVLEAELAAKKLSELKKQALSTPGVQPASVAEVDDFDDPKAELISRLLAIRENELLEETKALREGLSSQKLSALKRRAVGEGLDVSMVDDADDPKAAVVQLLLQAHSPMVENGAKSSMVDQGTRDPGSRGLDRSELEESIRAAVTSELTPMKLRAARKHVVDIDKIPESEINQALEDSEHPKMALIELVVGRRSQQATASTSAQHELTAQAEAAIRDELAGLKMGALRQRAMADGVSDGDIEDADDSDLPRNALVDLIVATRRQETAEKSAPSKPAADALKQELRHMTLSALRKRAAVAGVEEREIDGADDDEDPRGAMIGLIVRKEAPLPPSTEKEELTQVLQQTKMSTLRKRAVAIGLDQAKVDRAGDDEDPRAALISLIVEEETAEAPRGARLALQDQPSSVDGAMVEALLNELRPMKMSALRKRALAARVTGERLDKADDADNPQAALISLIVEAECPPQSPRAKAVVPGSFVEDSSAATVAAALKQELAPMKMSQLRKRGIAVGVDPELLDDAEDDDNDPRGAIISLIVSKVVAQRNDVLCGNAQEQQANGASAKAARKTLEAELSDLKISALRKKALNFGIDEDIVDDACDSDDDPRGALVQAILMASSAQEPVRNVSKVPNSSLVSGSKARASDDVLVAPATPPPSDGRIEQSNAKKVTRSHIGTGELGPRSSEREGGNFIRKTAVRVANKPFRVANKPLGAQQNVTRPSPAGKQKHCMLSYVSTVATLFAATFAPAASQVSICFQDEMQTLKSVCMLVIYSNGTCKNAYCGCARYWCRRASSVTAL